MTKRAKPSGKCKLLGLDGPFARSHIIPRFLADKALGQAHRIEFGEGGARPNLTFNSWIDPELCSTYGEERLRDIDTEAAVIFRKSGLSWRHFPIIDTAKQTNIGSELTIIEIPDIDSEKLRLFLLSLLWRSAASSRYPFAEIHLPVNELEYLRRIGAGEEQATNEDWPAVLVLLTDRGEPQVHAPLAQEIDMKALGFDLPSVPIFRFFLDGLIVHMGRRPHDKALRETWRGRIVGEASTLTLIGRPYEGSSQEANLQKLKDELLRDHPDAAVRIHKALWKIDSEQD